MTRHQILYRLFTSSESYKDKNVLAGIEAAVTSTISLTYIMSDKYFLKDSATELSCAKDKGSFGQCGQRRTQSSCTYAVWSGLSQSEFANSLVL